MCAKSINNSHGIANNNTTKGAGIILIDLFLMHGQPIIITKLTTPIIEAFGSKLMMNLGMFNNNSIGPIPFAKAGLSFNKTGICFAIMIIPIAANIP